MIQSLSIKQFCNVMHLIKSTVTLLKPGSILPERTTTTGDSLPVTHIKAFHMIKADVTIIPKQTQTKIIKLQTLAIRFITL